MKLKIHFAAALVAFMLPAGALMAQELIIYPAKGQSQEQMEKDKFECYSWAKNQTGFDPMQMPTATAPPPSKQASGSTAGGVVKGGQAVVEGITGVD